MVILQIALVKAFLAKGLFWQFFFFPKFTMRAFIVNSPSTKFFHGATIVLLSTNRIFYQIYHHLRITIKVFLYLINFSWMFTFKSTCIFHDTANWQGGLFPPHGSHLPTSLISGRVALTKCDIKFSLFF